MVNKGGRRYLYRRTRAGLVPLPDLPENHPEFLAAYIAAESVKPKLRAAPGTISALIMEFLASPAFGAMATSSQAVWRRTLARISDERGHALVRDLRPEHLRRDIRALTPGAAQNRKKAWRSILRHAVDEGWIPADPSRDVRAPRGTVTPHRQWTRAEIAQFRAHWATGMPQRVAFEVIWWTGARCVDAAHLGWQMVDRDGWLAYTQIKTGGPATCPVRALPRAFAAFADDQRELLENLPSDRMQWIVGRTGKPRSVKALSQWFSQAATLAGLPDDCTAHGLRKARASALAEAGATTSQIGAWTGHASLTEISHYTRQADQRSILGLEQERNLGNRFGNSGKSPQIPK